MKVRPRAKKAISTEKSMNKFSIKFNFNSENSHANLPERLYKNPLKPTSVYSE